MEDDCAELAALVKAVGDYRSCEHEKVVNASSVLIGWRSLSPEDRRWCHEERLAAVSTKILEVCAKNNKSQSPLSGFPHCQGKPLEIAEKDKSGDTELEAILTRWQC